MKYLLIFLLIVCSHWSSLAQHKAKMVIWKFGLRDGFTNKDISMQIRRITKIYLSQCQNYELMYGEEWLESERVGTKPTNILVTAKSILEVLKGLKTPDENEQIIIDKLKYDFDTAIIGDIDYNPVTGKYPVFFQQINLKAFSNRNPNDKDRNLPVFYVVFTKKEIVEIKTIQEKIKNELDSQIKCVEYRPNARDDFKEFNNQFKVSPDDKNDLDERVRDAWKRFERGRELEPVTKEQKPYYLAEKNNYFQRRFILLLQSGVKTPQIIQKMIKILETLVKDSKELKKHLGDGHQHYIPQIDRRIKIYNTYIQQLQNIH